MLHYEYDYTYSFNALPIENFYTSYEEEVLAWDTTSRDSEIPDNHSISDIEEVN